MGSAKQFPQFSHGLRWLIWVALLIAAKYCTAEMFSSMADVEALVVSEKQVLNDFRNLLQEEREKVWSAQRYLRQIKADYGYRNESPSARSAGVQGSGLFKCLPDAVEDDFLIVSLQSSTVSELQSAVEDKRRSSLLPTEEDLTGASESFHRLQHGYRIPTKAIIQGSIPGTRRTIPFTYDESFLVGQKLALAGHCDSATVWLEMALELMTGDSSFSDLDLYVGVLDWLQYSIFYASGNVLKTIRISSEIKELKPDFENVDENLEKYREILQNTTEEEKSEMELEEYFTGDIFAEDTYHALCRGELQPPSFSPELRCHLANYSIPFLYLQPVKLERVHADPEVYVVHDAILEYQAERIKKIGHLQLIRAKVINETSATGSPSSGRIAKVAFLDESTDPVVAEVNRYAGLATNLDHKQAEPLQINNYGIGGLYLPHYDFFGGPAGSDHLVKVTEGDRIATLLFYMTDVEAGGATVFPNLNLTLFPEKGSAAFWYNLLPDGTPDTRTLHSGCPVLSGIKWVSNKWFHEVGQDIQRPCQLHQNGFANETTVA